MIDLDPQQSAERWHAIRQRATGSKDDPSIAAGPYQKLPDMLKTARKLGAELVLIDTPPKLDKAIVPSLKAATLVLVPVKSTVLDLQALEDSADLVNLGQGPQQDGRRPERGARRAGKETAIKESLRCRGSSQAGGRAGAAERAAGVQPGPEDRSRRYGDREEWHGGQRDRRALRSALGARHRRRRRVTWRRRRYR